VVTEKKNRGKGKLSEEQFVIKAIESLRKGGYRGIHARFSGFNEAFRAYFGKNSDPVGATNRLAKAGKIVTRPCKGGVMLYKPDEAPVAQDSGKTALATMGIA